MNESDPGHVRLGTKIGPYELVEILGEGGMGQVYLARQREPIRREVALKLIRSGLDSKRVIARFEAERQSLALMEHANIAKILDAGSTEDGLPYFVMEYVPGIPITTYCDRHRLSTAERLTLFIEVCGAVQHAHYKGIIHRDLKPSNILVEFVGDQHQAKIIDFGVSKATAQQLVERSMFTELGQLVGTPEYMSPEQAEQSDTRVDTRTDIYSLGVLLYELLIGVLPFDSKTLRAQGLAEIHRILREDEPPLPSTRLSSEAGESSDTAARRRTTMRILLSELRGDLDWIVMKAMAKERSRRYSSASELAHDIHRFLKHEPVLAGAPTLGYRARKFARRNRAAVIAAAFVILAMLGGTAVSSWQAIRATRAEVEARHQTELASRTRDYLVSVFQQANPAVNPLGRETSIQEALDRAVEQLGDRFEHDPELDASLRSTLSEAYGAMGEFETAAAQATETLAALTKVDAQWSALGFRAQAVLAAALDHEGRDGEASELMQRCMSRPEYSGLEPVDRAVVLRQLAEAQSDLGHYAAADSLMLDTIEALRLETDDSDAWFNAKVYRAGILRTMSRHVEAEEILLELLASMDTSPRNLYQRSFLLTELAALLRQQDRLDEARQHAHEALVAKERMLGPKHPSVAGTLNTLAGIEVAALDFERSLEYSDRSIAIFTELVGAEHPLTLSAYSFRAEVIAERDGRAAALELYQELLATRIRVQGEMHPSVVAARVNVGIILSTLARYDEAELALSEAIDVGEHSLHRNHLYVVSARMSLAKLLRDRGDYPAAREAFETILADAAADPNVGRYHPAIMPALNNYAQLLGTLGEHEKAEEIYREYLQVSEARFPLGTVEQATVWNNIGTGAQAQGDLDGASAAYLKSIAMKSRFLGEDHAELAVERNNLASIERKRGNYVEAEKLFARVIEQFREQYGDVHPNVSIGLHNHGFTLIFLERYDEAEEEIQAAIAGIVDLVPPTHLMMMVFRGSLGYCRGYQERFEEAEADLLWSHENFVEQLGGDHERAHKVAGYLAETYERWGRSDEAAEWRAKSDG